MLQVWMTMLSLVTSRTWELDLDGPCEHLHDEAPPPDVLVIVFHALPNLGSHIKETYIRE